MGLGIADVLVFGRAVPFPDDGGLVGPFGEMPVEAVGGHVERAVMIPAHMDVAAKRDVLHLAVGLDPVQALALLAPELLRIGDRGLIELEIASLVDPGIAGERFGNGKDARVGHGARTALPGPMFPPAIVRDYGRKPGPNQPPGPVAAVPWVAGRTGGRPTANQSMLRVTYMTRASATRSPRLPASST